MDPRMPSPNANNATAMRVLSRPASNPRHSRASPLASLDAPVTLPEGVVVIGFVSRRPEFSSQIINRVLDSNVFGSGRLDKPFYLDGIEEFHQWFKHKKISYYYEEDRGIVYLQFCTDCCTVIGGFSGPNSKLDSLLGDQDLDELLGLLFVFSVCHVVIYIQEGSNFNTQVLKKFKVLQAAKHAWALNAKAKPTPSLATRTPSISNQTNLTGSSPAKSDHMRNASANSFAPGLVSHSPLFPGHLVPVMHFVFVDEFLEASNISVGVEESPDNSSFNQSNSLNTTEKSNFSSSKVSGAAVTLSRPPNKSDCGFRKKLQSSLDAQIRFLIKKCRTLSAPESSYNVFRSGVALNQAPLFVLDASRAVTLINSTSNQINESLEFTINLVEAVLMGKETSDILLHESHEQTSNKEDIQMLKEFIHRQSDGVRGRGGTVTNANSGTSPSVGMVAVAAAAAAAAASSGKVFSVPKLPKFETWKLSSKDTLYGILSSTHGNAEKKDSVIISSNKVNMNVSSKRPDTLDLATSLLECVGGLNTKFSTAWCEKSLPIAMEVYMKDLPPCYPTSLHENQLEKALHSFHSMVRGPAVDSFAKKLEFSCISIWKSGRQQCDAISLSGNPCTRQKHEFSNDDSSGLHSSGYFFLHACACGRSRCLRPDPFDLESANVNFNCFPECDTHLPVAHLPNGGNDGVVLSSSWKLIRIGSASYYEPSKGILQSGFSSTQRFLLKWIITHSNSLLFDKSLPLSHVDKAAAECAVDSGVGIGMNGGITKLQFGNIQTGPEHQRLSSEKTWHAERKVPNFSIEASNSTVRKFADVVAGSSTSDDSFPALKNAKSTILNFGTSKKQNKVNELSEENYTSTNCASQIFEGHSSGPNFYGKLNPKSWMESNASLRFGSNVNDRTKTSKDSMHPVAAYFGFEHECPRGHRFFLSNEIIGEQNMSCFSPEYGVAAVPMDRSNLVSHRKNSRTEKGVDNEKYGDVTQNKAKGIGPFKEAFTDSSIKFNGTKVSRLSKELNQISLVSKENMSGHVVDCDGQDSYSSLLNQDLPLYMTCPYCAKLKNKKVVSKVNFADGISQLQRIFLVTPPLPVVLATCPVIHFEASCLPTSIREESKQLQFSFGCPVVLPPESFIILRLPFVYGTQLENGSFHPLKYFDSHPERTAWVKKGTALQVLSKEPGTIEKHQLT